MCERDKYSAAVSRCKCYTAYAQRASPLLTSDVAKSRNIGFTKGTGFRVECPDLCRRPCLRRCETHSQCVSLAPPREPLKLSLLYSIVFHIALRGGSTHNKIAWVQQRQHHRAHESARERMLSLALRLCETPPSAYLSTCPGPSRYRKL